MTTRFYSITYYKGKAYQGRSNQKQFGMIYMEARKVKCSKDAKDMDVDKGEKGLSST